MGEIMTVKNIKRNGFCLMTAILLIGGSFSALAAHEASGAEPAASEASATESGTVYTASETAASGSEAVPGISTHFTWKEDRDGKILCVDDNGQIVKRAWVPFLPLSKPDVSGKTAAVSSRTEWSYAGPSGSPAKGRWSIGDQYYLFDPDGRMLTGWISLEDGDAEPFAGAVTENSPELYYCTADGYMVRNCFMALQSPEQSEDDFDDADSLDGMERWYYFDSRGRLKRDCKTTVDGKEYCFSESGKMMTGWVFLNSNGSGSRLISVDSETPLEDFDEFKSDMGDQYVSSFRYCSESGAVVKNDWVSVMPYDEAIVVEPIVTKFRFDKDGALIAAKPGAAKGMTLAKTKSGGGSYSLKSYGTPAVLKEIDGKTYAFDKNGKPIKKLVYLEKSSSKYKKGFYCFSDANAAFTGDAVIASDEESRSYSYYFAEKSGGGYSKGQGYSGIHNGKLYYQGLAIQADPNEEYELVYVEALDKKSNDTGMFIVDTEGRIKNGSIRLSDGYKYQTKKAGNYGYKITRIDDKKVKTVITPDMIIAEDCDGTDCEGVGIYRYIGKFEEEGEE